MKREHLIFLLSTALSLAVAAGILRAIEPRLFNRPKDLEVVQLDTAVPAFFNAVFREADRSSTELLLHDPITVVRGRPFLPEVAGAGPHDLLGFRNRSVPTHAAVVAIGDSQTYGNNAPLEESWPGVLSRTLGATRPVYSMAVGGWSPVQYVAAARAATFFNPKVIVAAIYSGNDLLEATRAAYSVGYWKGVRPEADFTTAMIPGYPLPPPESDIIRLPIRGTEIAFNPTLRLLANDRRHRAVQLGIRIVRESVRLMKAEADRVGAVLVLLLLPSKESVYTPALVAHDRKAPPEFLKLEEAEKANREEIVAAALEHGGIAVINPLRDLSEAAARGESIYPIDFDGHPLSRGYEIIAHSVAETVAPLLPPIRDGLYVVSLGDEKVLYQVAQGARRVVGPGDPGINPAEAVRAELKELMAIPLASKSG